MRIHNEKLIILLCSFFSFVYCSCVSVSESEYMYVCLCFIWCSCKPFGLIYSKIYKVHPPRNEWNIDNWRWLCACISVLPCECVYVHMPMMPFAKCEYVFILYCTSMYPGTCIVVSVCIWMMVSVDTRTQCVRIIFCIESELENYRQSTKAGYQENLRNAWHWIGNTSDMFYAYTHITLSVALKLWCRLNKKAHIR